MAFGIMLGASAVFRSAINPSVDAITNEVIAGAIEVHRTLGPGLLERAYASCLCRELRFQGKDVKVEVPIPVIYRGETLDIAYRADMLVDDLVVVEIKAIQQLVPVHIAQTITYVTLLEKPVGLLLNFNAPLMREGIMRILPRRPHVPGPNLS